jgi:hypothetical protein
VFNFTAVLMQKVGSFDGAKWEKLPVPLVFNPDLDLTDSSDPIKYLLIGNTILTPAVKSNGAPWQGAREKSNVFF